MATDDRGRYYNERIVSEKNNIQMLTKEARIYSLSLQVSRTRSLNFSKALAKFSAQEKCRGLQSSVQRLSDLINEMETQRKTMIDYFDQTVWKLLRSYPSEFKEQERTLASRNAAVKKKIASQEKFAKAQQAGKDPSKINQAQVDVSADTTGAYQANKLLDASSIKFEAKRLEDLKSLMLDLAESHMYYHARALEAYTDACAAISEMSVESDMQDHLTWVQNHEARE
eukprot:GILK01007776.1.p1 GENE.GILK01007776.1~~GILK01007776.1.p1  ORF type:complete len:227 (+),score=29.91 GILK01007776.1:45-725(+)